MKAAPTGAAAVGWTVGIWWPEDLVYYYGQLTEYNAEAGTHAVLYDMDGITEHVTLTEHKVEWVAPGEVRAGAGAPEASGHSSGNAAGGKDAKRLKAEQQILEGLKMAGAEVGAEAGADPEALAAAIEGELYGEYCRPGGAITKPYATQLRTVVFNLRNRANTEFRAEVLRGTIRPKELRRMDSAAMASGDQKAERRRLELESEKRRVLDAEQAARFSTAAAAEASKDMVRKGLVVPQKGQAGNVLEDMPVIQPPSQPEDAPGAPPAATTKLAGRAAPGKEPAPEAERESPGGTRLMGRKASFDKKTAGGARGGEGGSDSDEPQFMTFEDFDDDASSVDEEPEPAPEAGAPGKTVAVASPGAEEKPTKRLKVSEIALAQRGPRAEAPETPSEDVGKVVWAGRLRSEVDGKGFDVGIKLTLARGSSELGEILPKTISVVGLQEVEPSRKFFADMKTRSTRRTVTVAQVATPESVQDRIKVASISGLFKAKGKFGYAVWKNDKNVEAYLLPPGDVATEMTAKHTGKVPGKGSLTLVVIHLIKWKEAKAKAQEAFEKKLAAAKERAQQRSVPLPVAPQVAAAPASAPYGWAQARAGAARVAAAQAAAPPTAAPAPDAAEAFLNEALPNATAPPRAGAYPPGQPAAAGGGFAYGQPHAPPAAVGGFPPGGATYGAYPPAYLQAQAATQAAAQAAVQQAMNPREVSPMKRPRFGGSSGGGGPGYQYPPGPGQALGMPPGGRAQPPPGGGGPRGRGRPVPAWQAQGQYAAQPPPPGQFAGGYPAPQQAAPQWPGTHAPPQAAQPGPGADLNWANPGGYGRGRGGHSGRGRGRGRGQW